MVDIMDICKSLSIIIGKVMKNPEMLKCASKHLKTKKMSKHAVNKLPYLLRYVPHRYRTQQMREEAILESGGTLKSVPD